MSRPTLSTNRWQKLRRRILRRDGFTCQSAHSTLPHGGGLEVDHIEPVETHPEREWDESNLRTLCRSHHIERGRATLSPEAAAWRAIVERLLNDPRPDNPGS